ncbi:MAG: RNA pseudouridine synthase [Magnetospirillum sp.]|nr:RNA pseudouridine synthase [Magnetospirillum sp.]
MDPSELEARLLYRDGMMLILDKPPGLAVHAGPRGGPSLRDDLDGLRFGLPQAPELAHRLDRDTSGCLVLGRHRKALARLGKLFAEGQVRKTYWAIVVGKPPQAAGLIDLPLLKENRKSGWRMKVDAKGQASQTEYSTIGSVDGSTGALTWLSLAPKTGRTHQLRVHLAAIGCPILGDPVYGGDATKAAEFPLHLHAREIRVPLYPRRAPIKAVAEVPAHMHVAMRSCGWKDGPREAQVPAA